MWEPPARHIPKSGTTDNTWLTKIVTSSHKNYTSSHFQVILLIHTIFESSHIVAQRSDFQVYSTPAGWVHDDIGKLPHGSHAAFISLYPSSADHENCVGGFALASTMQVLSVA